jgi:galactose mutarotase-like enzyme
MYLAMVRERLASLYETVWRKNLMRSGLVTGVLLAGLLIGLTIAYRAHMQGNFHKLKLKANIDSEREDAPVPRPGGQDAIVLTRSAPAGTSTAEFLSVTLLPGRGMNVLQITAYIPGKGEVNLLASPSLQGAADAMTGKGADADGQASLEMGGAFEAPWTGSIWGAPTGNGHVTVNWQGHTLQLPAAGKEAQSGLILAQGADTVTSETLPDGGTAQAVFHEGDFNGQWLSKTDLTITVLLSSRAMDLTVVASNAGDVAEPIGIGWHPRFFLFDGDRSQWRLHLPAEMRAVMRDRERTQPVGVLVPVAGTAFDYTADAGVKLGATGLDESFAGLRQKLLNNGPVAELSDPAAGFGLRMTALSPRIRAMHVVAPAGGRYISIDPGYNYPDPLGNQWPKEPESGMTVLQPGESTEWKVRLELFNPAGPAPAR